MDRRREILARVVVTAMNLRAIFIATALLLIAANASAQVDPFEFEVYPYQTEGKGMVELESLNSFVPNGHNHGGAGTSAGDFASQAMYRTAFELTYGLTDHLEAAAYLNLAHPNADSFQYAGSKFRVRGSLFEQGELPVDLGWYLELEWHRTPQFDDNQLELEFKGDHRERHPQISDLPQPDFREGGFRRTQQEQGTRVRLRGGCLLRLPARDFARP